MRPFAIFCFLGLLALARAQTDNNTAEKVPTLSVVGSGKVTVEPDVGKINVVVTATRPSVTEACAVAANATDAVMQAAGGAAKNVNVTTQNINVQPNITYGENGAQLRDGFTCQQSLEIKVTARSGARLDAAISGALDAAITAGGDLLQVSSLSTDLSEELRRAATNQAREQAVADAQETANTLATAAKLQLGEIQSLVDNNIAPPSPVPFPMQTAGAGAAMDAAVSTPIQTGTTDVVATVAIDYAISSAA